MKAIINGKIIKENEVLSGKALVYDQDIMDIVDASTLRTSTCKEVLDAAGNFVSPGFINMHIHGCAGVDAMDAEPHNIATMRTSLLKTGVTAFLPTTMTYDFDSIYKALDKIRREMAVENGARVLGANVEGPFIHPDFKGAHDPRYIVEPSFARIAEYADVIRLMTVAPECVQEELFVQKCKDNGIILSIGHSSAVYEDAIAALQNGFTHITHMYNAMPVFNHRKPGVIGAAMDSDAVCELITDNIHVHPAMQRILYRQKDAEQIVLVTDSMRACMLPDGEYELGGQPVIVKDYTAKLKNGVIAGSVLTMDRAVQNFKENTGAPVETVIKMVTANPAKELKIYDKIGSLDSGKKADIAIFNNKIEIMTTIVNGEIVYRRS